MAHKKAGGSSRNGRDSEAKRLGVKRFGGETVLAGRDTCDKKQFSIIGFRHIQEISGKKDRAIRLFIVSIFNFIKMIYF